MNSKKPPLFQRLESYTILIVPVFFGILALVILIVLNGPLANPTQLAIGLAGVSAVFAAVSAYGSLAQAVSVERQRQSQERPYVIAYFDSASNGAVYFVVENRGNSPACNVTFRFNPAPIDFHGRSLDKVSVFANPITFLPSGQQLRQIVDVGYRLLAEGRPTKFIVGISYYSVAKKHYGEGEAVEHDLEYLKQATVPLKGTEDYLKVVSEKVDRLVFLFEKIIKDTSLLVETPEQYNRRREDFSAEKEPPSRLKNCFSTLIDWFKSRLP